MGKSYIVIVTGGRRGKDKDLVYKSLDAQLPVPNFIVVGSREGYDGLAIEWCIENGVPYAVVDAHWNKYGRAAGPIRNRWMLRLKPSYVMAFPGGNGTVDMIMGAEKNCISVIKCGW